MQAMDNFLDAFMGEGVEDTHGRQSGVRLGG